MILARVWQEVSTKGQGGKKNLLGKSVFYPFSIFRLDKTQNIRYIYIISGNLFAHI
jgi:hypothetical protein